MISISKHIHHHCCFPLFFFNAEALITLYSGSTGGRISEIELLLWAATGFGLIYPELVPIELFSGLLGFLVS